jgi:hypothetical protein
MNRNQAVPAIASAVFRGRRSCAGHERRLNGYRPQAAVAPLGQAVTGKYNHQGNKAGRALIEVVDRFQSIRLTASFHEAFLLFSDEWLALEYVFSSAKIPHINQYQGPPIE